MHHSNVLYDVNLTANAMTWQFLDLSLNGKPYFSIFRNFSVILAEPLLLSVWK